MFPTFLHKLAVDGQILTPRMPELCFKYLKRDGFGHPMLQEFVHQQYHYLNVLSRAGGQLVRLPCH